jgi:7,8-dihydroneopterin aldolase/epimerase/oxygenase
MMTILLTDLLFHAYHGVYAEEQKLGGSFKVNIEINCQTNYGKITNLDQSINYVKVYQLVSQRMTIPTPLLEELVMDVADSILENFPLAEDVLVKVEKCHPPIEGIQGSVGVATRKHRK